MKIGPIMVYRADDVEAVARRIAASLAALEAVAARAPGMALRFGMRRHHEELRRAAEAAGLDVVALTGGLPKPPEEDER